MIRRLLTYFLFVTIAASVYAWENCGPRPDGLVKHVRAELKNGKSFGVKYALGDTSKWHSVTAKLLSSGYEDEFNRAIIRLQFAHGEGKKVVEDSTVNLKVFNEDERQEFSIRIRRNGDEYSLEAGENQPLFRCKLENVDYDDFLLEDFVDADVKIVRNSLIYQRNEPIQYLEGDAEEFANDIMLSQDAKEGVWAYYDHTPAPLFVSNKLKYKLASVRNNEGYDLVLLDAEHEIEAPWKPLAVKARLKDIGTENVYNLQWYDADGQIYDEEANAKFDGRTLTLYFPYRDFTLRFIRIYK